MKNKRFFLIISFFALLFFSFSYLKISFGLGSYKFFFTGMNFIIPIFGAFFSFPLTLFFLGVLFFIKKILLGGMITLGVPTLVSTIALNLMFKKENRSSFLINFGNFIFRVILPIFAIVTFVMHPVGQQAYLYSFYWLIPIFLYFIKDNSIFTKALTTTFIAHAIGSLMWLYFIPMTSVQWLSLIPVVAIERLVFASGMVIFFLGIKKIISLNFRRREKKSLVL